MIINEQMKKIFIFSIFIIAIFGYLDAQQIIPWQESQLWETYEKYVAPVWISQWIFMLAGIATIYYIIRKDKSEAVGIFIASLILLYGGVQDVFFFVLSPNTMATQMCWFSGTQAFVSKILGEACVSPLSLVLNALLFTYIAWRALIYFFKAKW